MRAPDLTTMITMPTATVPIGSPEDHLDRLAFAQHYNRAWFEDETPQHRVTVPAFLIDPHPVTNAEWSVFTGSAGYRTGAELRDFGLAYGDAYWQEVPSACWHTPSGTTGIGERMDHPVVHVDHTDATVYARWAGKRLPSETEWEYTAHGPAWQPWPWGDDFDPSRVNCAEHWAGQRITGFTAWRIWWAAHIARHGRLPATTPPGSLAGGMSPCGAADMAGNVAEWTASTYRPYDATATYDPVYEAAFGRYRVVRGGSWMNFRYQVRTSERIAIDPGYSSFALGFRCAADIPASRPDEQTVTSGRS